MEQINSLIKYSDWLICFSGRNKIEPKVGDKTIVFNPIIEDNGKCYDCKFEYIINSDDVYNKRIKANSYVEVPYPVINWTDETINPDIIFGTIGIFNIIQIHKTKLKGYENEWSFQRPDTGNVFEGTLTECKIKVNELLYKNK